MRKNRSYAMVSLYLGAINKFYAMNDIILNMKKIRSFMGEIEYANVSLPIAAVLLIMMYPIMLKVRYSELLQIRKNAKVMAFTVVINWAIQPFVMAIIAWFFMTIVFSSIIPEKLSKEYMMGMIILGLAPCTAMTLV